VKNGPACEKRRFGRDYSWQGGRIDIEQPIHISNVLPVDPKSSKGSRVRYELDSDGGKRKVTVDGSEISVVRRAGKS
jgi:large subunit ribosomal protein L24